MPPADHSLRRQLLAVLDALPFLGDGADDAPAEVAIRRGGQQAVWTFTAEDLRQHAAETSPLVGLADDARAILGQLVAAAPDALNGKEIANALRREYEPGFRKHLAPGAPLRARGLVEHTDGDGYAATELAVRLWPAVDNDEP